MVKRKGNLISSLCNISNILIADSNARKAKKRSKRFIEKHDQNIIDEDMAIGEAIEIVDSLKRFTDKEKRLSKYAACGYLNVSRATFDNYVREGKLPRGKYEIGFKELSWSKKELDEFVKKCRDSTLLRSRKHSPA